MRAWKWIGLAGVVGLATAAGFYVARQRRTWDEAEPDELRARLHARADEARARRSADVDASAGTDTDADQINA
ncbi:MAG: hypothetical protein AAFY28_21495 [Actinomycetota bacterium]